MDGAARKPVVKLFVVKLVVSGRLERFSERVVEVRLLFDRLSTAGTSSNLLLSCCCFLLSSNTPSLSFLVEIIPRSGALLLLLLLLLLIKVLLISNLFDNKMLLSNFVVKL